VTNPFSEAALYRDRASTQYNFCHDGKKHAIPSLHRDNFLAKVPGPARCLRRVTQPPFIAGPLANIALRFSNLGIPALLLINIS